MALSHLVIAVLVSLFESDWASHAGAAWVAVGCVSSSSLPSEPLPSTYLNLDGAGNCRCLYTFTAAYGISYGPVGESLSPLITVYCVY